MIRIIDLVFYTLNVIAITYQVLNGGIIYAVILNTIVANMLFYRLIK